MSYLRAYTLGPFLLTSWRIYLRDWITLFLIYVIPLAIVHVFNTWIKTMGGVGLALGTFSFLLASMFVSFPLTVAISEICLDIKPSVGRSYQRAFAQPGKLVGSYLLTFAILVVGFVLLVVPGVVFSVWYAFVGPVVVLESFAGRAALRRSRELGRGYYLRNFGIFFLGQFLTLLIALLIGFILGFALGFFFGVGREGGEFAGGLVGLVVAPPSIILVVLLYYDMRVRKEGYAAAQLADDLRF
jgi:hypothetical protein